MLLSHAENRFLHLNTDRHVSGYWKVYNNPGRAKMIFWAYDKAKTSAVNEYLIGKNIRDIAYVAAC